MNWNYRPTPGLKGISNPMRMIDATDESKGIKNRTFIVEWSYRVSPETFEQAYKRAKYQLELEDFALSEDDKEVIVALE